MQPQLQYETKGGLVEQEKYGTLSINISSNQMSCFPTLNGFQKTKITRKVTSTYEKFPIFELEAKHGESERIMTFVWGTKHRHLIYRLLK